MKIQQRSFVVEYKSGRRHVTKQPSSIWGDTNFKELVKQAKEDSPRLFEQGEMTAVPVVEADDVVETISQTEPADSCPEVPDLNVSEAQLVDSDAVEETVSPALQILPQPVKRRPRKLVKAELDNTRVSSDIEAAEMVVEMPVDELALLEDENRRLKALLTKRLLRENAELRTMLERFDIA